MKKSVFAFIIAMSVAGSGCARAGEGSGAMQDGVSALTAVAAPAVNGTISYRLGEWTTAYKDATKSRAHNIELAAKSINDKVVEPEGTFSFNEAVGPTSKARGYMLGRIFIKGKDAKGYGGGVCQVSSTLFNAVDQAGLEIVERHTHSKAVNYVEEGRDAATSYGGKDFKFKNNQPFPVLIKCGTENQTVTVILEKA